MSTTRRYDDATHARPTPPLRTTSSAYDSRPSYPLQHLRDASPTQASAHEMCSVETAPCWTQRHNAYVCRTTLCVSSAALVLLCGAWMVTPVLAGCRNQERVACETVCQYNATRGRHVCTIRAAVILPNDTRLEASLQRVSGSEKGRVVKLGGFVCSARSSLCLVAPVGRDNLYKRNWGGWWADYGWIMNRGFGLCTWLGNDEAASEFVPSNMINLWIWETNRGILNNTHARKEEKRKSALIQLRVFVIPKKRLYECCIDS